MTDCINPSGLWPLGSTCLVKIDEVEEVSKGGIILTPQTVEQQQWKSTEGTLLAMGSLAFEHCGLETINSQKRKPQPGDRVLVKQNTLYRVKGKDGKDYNQAADLDILCVIEQKDLTEN